MEFYQQVLRFLAINMGMDVGPDSLVEFSFELFPKGGAGLAVMILLAAFFAFGIFSLSGLTISRHSWMKRTVGVLRGTALILPILVFLNPSLKVINRKTLPGTTLVFIDSSWSMRHVDPVTNKRRIDLVQDLLMDKKTAFLDRLSSGNRLKIFLFDSRPRLHPVGPGKRWERITPKGRTTNLSSVLEKVLTEESSGRVAAAIIFTDGSWNVGTDPMEAAETIAKYRIPIYFVGPGSLGTTPGITITGIDVPDQAFLKDPFEIRVSAEIPEGTGNIVARLLENGREIDSRNINLESKKIVSIPFKVEPKNPGTFRYTVELSGYMGGKEKSTSIKALVEVATIPLRILLISGSPNWEYRNLWKLFQRDNTIDLSCWLQSADSSYPQKGNHPIKKLPESGEELKKYHEIIMIDPDPKGFNIFLSKNIEKEVRNEGMGLIFVAGEINTLSFFDKTTLESITGPVASLLPARPDQQIADVLVGMGRMMQREWKMEPTPEGLAGKILALESTPDATRRLFDILPGIYWNYPFHEPLPGSHVICVHPGTDPLHRTQKGPRPLIIWHHAGAGKVMLSAIDETWRWKSVAEKAWNRFWINAARFIGEGKILSKKGLHVLSTGRKFYEAGVEVTISDRLPSNDRPSSLAVEIFREGKKVKELQLKPGISGNKELSGSFVADEPGYYEIKVKGKQKYVPARFYVREPYLERVSSRNEKYLEKLAARSGGSFFRIEEAAGIPDKILPATEILLSESRPMPVWDNWVLLGISVFLLSIEWILRKLMNLP